MSSIIYEIMSKRTFLFNSFCHSLLAILYTYQTREKLHRIISENVGWDAEFGRVAFIVGHFIIATTQFLLSNKNEENHITVSYLGSLGHSCLLVYIMWLNIYAGLNWKTKMFAAGQCGMIYFYMNHTEPSEIAIKSAKITNRQIFLSVFSVMAFYYIVGAMNEKTTLKYGLSSVAIVYSILLYNYFVY